MKKVLIIIQELTGGGAEKVAANLSIGLSELGYPVYIYVNNTKRLTYKYDGTIVSPEIISRTLISFKIINFIKKVLFVRKIKIRYGIDVSISFLNTSNIINILTKKKEKVIISSRNFPQIHKNFLKEFIYKSIIKYFYNKANIIVTVSNLLKFKLINEFHLKKSIMKTIYNPIITQDVDNLKIEEFSFPTCENSIKLVNVGSLYEQKNQIFLIYLAKEIINRGYNVNLFIVGQGPLLEKLSNLAIKLNVAHNIHFFGFMDNPYKIIFNSDLFIFPSNFEGFPNALIESMSCGTVPIVADCESGPREILLPNIDVFTKLDYPVYTKSGVLLPVPRHDKDLDLKLWANVIIDLYTNPILRGEISLQTKKQVSHLDIKSILKEWILVIETNGAHESEL
jgi:glycosyltransferase involved in cell wall biosynthesis